MASRDIKELALPARLAYEAWYADCKNSGIDVLTYCTYRDAKEQNELYAQGRTKGGEVVTNARGGDSFHQYRCAWDCVPMKNGKPQWNDRAAYKRMAELAKSHGIEWAGDWVSFKETAHFQFTNGLTIKDFKAGKEL